MSADQRAYWSWVGSINEGGRSALASGIALLEDKPHLPALYLRLAEVCLEEDAVATCKEAYRQVQPPDSLTLLYREAALARLNTQTEADTTGRYWLPLAQDPRLDPTLARLIVDAGTMQQDFSWLDTAEETWHKVLAADSSQAGAAFGLGYAAVKQYDWDEGESLLQQVTELLPDDSQAYRELGRIYYNKGEQEKLEDVLERGILAAQKQHDLSAELTLSGNLGWSLFMSNGDLHKAEVFLKEALEKSRILSENRREGFNLYRLANLYTRQYRYDEALTLLDSADVVYAEHIPERHASIPVLQGDILSRLYRFREADSLLKAAIVEAEKHQLRDVKVHALSSLTTLQYEMGQYATARKTGLQALVLAQQDRLTASEMRARMFLGDVERRLGNFEAALDHFEQGLVLAKKSQSINAQSLTSRLGRIALNLEDAATAKKRFEDLLNTSQEMPASNLARAYRGLGDAYMQFENTTEAIAYYNKALQQLPEHEYEEIRQGVLRAKAYAMLEAAKPDSAIALFQEIQRTGAGSSGQAYFLESGLGQAYLDKQMFEVALQHFQEADAIEQEVNRPSVHWSVLFGKALAYWHLDQLAEAEEAFRGAIGLIEAIRENLDSSERRASYTQGKGRVYEYFAAFLEAQRRETE
ncbi:MAG TPA: tetratricopeptide repeat protein, partial [Rhodothermales bacterium]|nr:tetratricopeptide repeat protein [Rhodothermales bacterium]